MAVQLCAPERDADRQAVGIALVPPVRQKAEAFDVVEKFPDVDAAIARRHFDVEREQPIEGKQLAAL